MAITTLYGTSGTLGVALGQVWTPPTSGVYSAGDQPPFALGQITMATDGSMWVYCVLGTGGVTETGYACTFNEDFLAVMLSETTELYGKAVGIPAAGVAIAGDYLWLQRTGTIAAVQVAASAAANVDLVPTATDGQLDDGVATGLFVKGLVLTTARAASAGTAPGFAAQPMVIDTLYEPETP